MAGKSASKDGKSAAAKNGAKSQAKVDTKAVAKPASATPNGGDKEKHERQGVLAFLRPKPRPVFFLLFLLACAWIVLLADRCKIEGKRKDCGWPGISGTDCWSRSCFMHGGGGPKKKTVKVKREEGETLGLAVKEAADGTLRVEGISMGSLQKHNEKSKEKVLVGDALVKVEGSAKQMQKALQKTTGRTVELEIVRPRLPSFLAWLHNTDGKMNTVERVLSAPGTAYFASLLKFNFGVALVTWYVSGYGKSSLPAYFLLSAAVAYQLARCCHDDKVDQGVPHCYKGTREPMQVFIAQAWEATWGICRRAASDPRSYIRWLFVPEFA